MRSHFFNEGLRIGTRLQGKEDSDLASHESGLEMVIAPGPGFNR